jgi:hypothetical protein
MTTMAIAIGMLLTTATLAAAAGPQRVDLYDAASRRQGYVIVDERRGRLDIYDASSRRLGYGTIRGPRVDGFRLDGARTGSAVRDSGAVRGSR